MKKGDATPDEDDLRPEYDTSSPRAGVRGKYLDRNRAGTNPARLAPGARAAFPTDEAADRAPRSPKPGHDSA